MTGVRTAAALCGVLFCSAAAEEQPFYLTLDAPPAPELTPEQALDAFTIAPGYRIEAVAVEPLVEDPVAITWDETGAMYVAEMRGFMPDAWGNNQDAPVGAVVRLHDTNGDGRYDRREVMQDALVLPRAIAIVNDGLLIAEPPNLWLCPSPTGRARDISCADKRSLGEYGNQPGSVEHAENGLLPGIDNWLYSAKSSRRLRLVDGVLAEQPTLFRGQWGITQDNDGRLFYNTNSNLLLGDYYFAERVVAAGNRSAPGLGERISRNDQLFAVRVNPGVNRAYVPGVLREDGRLNRPTSASGMTTYRGDHFEPERLADVFVAEPAANAVVQLELERQGLALTTRHHLYPHPRWQQVEFLASTDERFRPVDVQVGPDGALNVVDMYRGIIQDHVFLTDELRAQALTRKLDKPPGLGRIWRVTREGRSLRSTQPDLGASDSKQLISLLGHPNAWHRHTAQRLLLARRDRGLDPLLQDAARSEHAHRARHALWTLAGRNALDAATVRDAVGRGGGVTLAALRAGAGQLSADELLALLAAQTQDDPVQRQATVQALAAHNHRLDVRTALRNTLLHASDPYLVAAVRVAASNQELTFLRELAASKAWSEESESATQFVQALVLQGFRRKPAIAAELLTMLDGSTWWDTAILDGLADASREPGFERAMLAAPHPAFASPDPDRWAALSRARRALTWPGDELAAGAKPLTPAEAELRRAGEAFYRSTCSSCHGEDGRGIASLGPPLVDTSWVTGPSERLVRIILHGVQGPIEVAGETWNSMMPGHGTMPQLTDEVAAGLIIWLHRAWGHTGRAVTPEFIARTRNQTKERTLPWTAEELASINVNEHYQQYAGRYGAPGAGLEFIWDGKDLLIKSAILNGPLVEQKEDHFLYEPRQTRLEFVTGDDGHIRALRMPTAEGEVLLPRLPD